MYKYRQIIAVKTKQGKQRVNEKSYIYIQKYGD